MMKNKRGQLTIFIIIAVIVVALVLLFFVLIPQINSNKRTTDNPQQYIDTCVREELEENVETISLQGGELEPEGYFTYNYIPIKYLCYTEDIGETCIIQQPQLRSSVEEEIADSIQGTVDNCFNYLKEDYESRGYEVTLEKDDVKVELLQETIIANLGYKITVEKDESERYENFNIILNNNLYELLLITDDMLEVASSLGSIDVTFFMDLLPEFRITKKTFDEGIKVYILENKKGGEKFQFASKNMPLAVGF